MPASIPYIEDLPPSQLLYVLKNLEDFSATEKVDGSQLLFGIDKKGFYTSRESKGGSRIYSAEDYEPIYSNTYRKFSHLFLEKNLETLMSAGLSTGDQIEIEVLYGNIPNVVPYNAGINRIVFLRATSGNLDFEKFSRSIRHFTDEITHTVPYTDDGVRILHGEQTQCWQTATVPVIHLDYTEYKHCFDEYISTLEYHINAQSGINSLSNVEAYTVPLNKKPDWCNNWKEVKLELKKHRDTFGAWYNLYRCNLKQFLLEILVNGRSSMLGDKNSWIEGVVLTNGTTTVKVVNKETFGKYRKFIWSIRNRLTSSQSSDMSLLFSTKESVRQILDTSHGFEHTQQALLSFLENTKKILSQKLDKYKKERKDYSIDLESIGKVVYNETVHERTLEVFSYLFAVITDLTDQVVCSSNLDDLRNRILKLGI